MIDWIRPGFNRREQREQRTGGLDSVAYLNLLEARNGLKAGTRSIDSSVCVVALESIVYSPCYLCSVVL